MTTDWRGTTVIPGATVIFSTGENNEPGEGEVVEVKDRAVKIKIKYRPATPYRVNTTVQLNKITVVESLPPCLSKKLTAEEEIKFNREREKVDKANYDSHTWSPRPHLNDGYPTWQAYRDAEDQWYKSGCVHCGVEPKSWRGTPATQSPCPVT